MKARYARQIRKGIRSAKNISWFQDAEHAKNLYQAFLRRATPLEWVAYQEYRFRHWSD